VIKTLAEARLFIRTTSSVIPDDISAVLNVMTIEAKLFDNFTVNALIARNVTVESSQADR